MPAADAAYDELCCYTLERGDAAFLHQHVVDAQLAQTADASTKPIGLTFALLGLYLHVERGVTGRDVQRAHMVLAKQKETLRWPSIVLPKSRGAMTAADVLRAAPGAERDRAIDDWCATVWREYCDANRAAIEEYLQRGGITPPPLSSRP